MKKGISLIELIFTMVIIAVVFTVVPKIVLALNKSDSVVVKQDALFNGMTMMQMLTHLSWDENSVESNDILQTPSLNQICNAAQGYYRLGGFKGSRNCENNITVSGIATEELDMAFYDDIDDFHDKNVTTSKYTLHFNVTPINDTIVYVGRNASIDFNATGALTPTNVKMLTLDISYSGNKGVAQGESISQFSYASSNIGKFYLGKRTWQ